MRSSRKRPLVIVIVAQWDSVTELAIDIATLSTESEAIGVHFASGSNKSQTAYLTKEWGCSIGTIPLVWVSVETNSPADELLSYLDRQHPDRSVRVLIPITGDRPEPWVDQLEQALLARPHLVAHHVRVKDQSPSTQ